MLSVETVTVVIERPYALVYEFLSDPRNLAKWVDILGPVQRPVSPMEWVFDQPAFHSGSIRVRFTPRNPYGVLDIRAYAGEHQIYWAPARAIDLGSSTAVTFGLVLEAGSGAPQAQRISEREWVEADLLTLKTLLEAT